MHNISWEKQVLFTIGHFVLCRIRHNISNQISSEPENQAISYQKGSLLLLRNKGEAVEEWQHIPGKIEKTDHQKCPPFWRTPRTGRTCHSQCDHRSQPAKNGRYHISHRVLTHLLLIYTCSSFGKAALDCAGGRKVLPKGRWHTRENTKQHSKHIPLFLPSSRGLVPGAFQHFDMDANDTLYWNVRYSCVFTQFSLIYF